MMNINSDRTTAAHENLHNVRKLEDDAIRARRAGKFDAAVGFDGLVKALRAGQLTPAQLNTSNGRCRLFGARALGL